MNNSLFSIYYGCIVVAAIVGIIRYRSLNTAMRMMAILMVITSISEGCAFIADLQKKYAIRYIVYNFYIPMEAFFFTAYFIYALKPHNYRQFIVYAAILWPLLSMINILFLQPVDTLNSHIPMLESFCFITASLYFIYYILKDDRVENIFRHPHFQMSIISLVMWSSTIFFWAFIQILYRSHWRFAPIVMHVHIIINMLLYLSIAAAFYFYRSNLARSERR